MNNKDKTNCKATKDKFNKTNSRKIKGKREKHYNDSKDYAKNQEKDPKYTTESRGNGSNRRSFDNSFSNDPMWYKHQPDLFNQAIKVPFNRILGDTMKVRPQNGISAPNKANYTTIPGVMTIDFAPTLGRVVGNMDAVNLAADRIYGYIYQQYTGAANFQKSDVIFQIMHEVSIAFLIGAAKRGLRALFSYSPVNHNFARNVYAACGFNPSNFDEEVRSYPETVKYLNKVILSFNSLYTPAITDLFEKWYALSSNIYADDETVDSQLFLFRPMGYYEFVEAHDDGSGTLIPAELDWIGFGGFNSNATNHVGHIYNYIDAAANLLSNIRNTSYFNVVNASIGKAFPTNSLLQIDPFLDGEILAPVFNKYINYQLNNAIVCPWVDNVRNSNGSSSLKIKDDPIRNMLVCEPTMTAATYNLLYPEIDQFYLNSYDGDTNEDFVIEATRLMPFTAYNKIEWTSAPAPVPIQCGDMLPISIGIYFVDMDYSTNKEVIRWASGISSLMNEVYHAGDDFTGSMLQYGLSNAEVLGTSFIAAYSKFRNAPLIYLSESGDIPWHSDASVMVGSTRSQFVNVVGDIYRYTLITRSGLEGLHDIAWLSILTGTTDSKTK